MFPNNVFAGDRLVAELHVDGVRAMGGIQTSANDYAKWVAFLLSGWPSRDGADEGPVRRSSVRGTSHCASAIIGAVRLQGGDSTSEVFS